RSARTAPDAGTEANFLRCCYPGALHFPRQFSEAVLSGIHRLAASGRPFILWNRTLSKAEDALEGIDGEARTLDWHDLTAAIAPGDVVVSMLPADLHPEVAERCLQRGAHFVSSSYLSPAMLNLDDAAKGKGLRFVNEVGLDPGIDHLMAHVLIADYQASGLMTPGHAHRFTSYCGGFPSQLNAFRYKFSWSPLGVLRALKTPARWIEHGAEATIDIPRRALTSYTVNLPHGQENFEAYPNRDSLPFTQQYGFTEEMNLQTFVRGTLRPEGWAEAWNEIFAVVEAANTEDAQLAALSDTLWSRHAYESDESDRVVLHVELDVTDNGQPVWNGSYVLDEHRNDSGTAMARLVSKTAGIAVEAILDNQIPPGVSAAPSDRETADAWLQELINSGERIIRS
ncbi:MAG: saccharopine dehydrogenase family protein, partial [Verrucomicrobiota bacterium]